MPNSYFDTSQAALTCAWLAGSKKALLQLQDALGRFLAQPSIFNTGSNYYRLESIIRQITYERHAASNHRFAVRPQRGVLYRRRHFRRKRYSHLP